ncbi:FecCD family ABC transporter permease [Polycladidibacter stylochi]|uniref:FecCD family ABC transporter permease n=1 Tax=Polycladidibacter stylochi TaxID=1807766 RepID=UPI0008319E5E|nr:iron ABC transporter permease [Pseudovibrio stylochi]
MIVKSFQWLTLLVALLLGAVLSLHVGGRADVGIADLLAVITHWDSPSLSQSIMVDIRLPRTLIAGLLGINMGLSGLILQAITRNNLASPSILGINQGAALGMTLAIMLPGFFPIADEAMAVLGALFAGILTFSFAGGLRAKVSPLRLILSGVAVGAFSFAMVRFSFTLDDEVSRDVILWTTGDVAGVRWHDTPLLLALSLFGIIASVLLAHRFNLLALGEAASQGVGANPHITLVLGALIAATLTGISVSVAGPIAFVGLVIPHLCRAMIGSNHRQLVPAVALGGAALMLYAEAFSKIVITGEELPLGVIAAIIGAPYFVYQALFSKEMGL